MSHSGQLNDRTIEIDGDEDVIFEDDDEEDKGYLFAGQGYWQNISHAIGKKLLTSNRMKYKWCLIYIQMVNPTTMLMLLCVEMLPMCRM
jgi:hypothetical protein